MYRFKGLEYRCLIIAGVAEGLVPRTSVDAWERTDPSRHRRELHRGALVALRGTAPGCKMTKKGAEAKKLRQGGRGKS